MSQPEQGPDTPRMARRWPAARHEAYLDSRPDATSVYNPAAEYGDVDWREPASDIEAAARTGWLAENTPPAPGWPARPLTPVENALEDAQERAVLSDRAHDPDPHAWVEYQQLQALDRLAPLPAHDALDNFPLDEHGQPDTLVAAFDRGDASDTANTAAPERLRQRLENLRAARAAEAVDSGPDEDEQRREQLLRWHDDDHRTASADRGSSDETGDSGTGSGGSGWVR